MDLEHQGYGVIKPEGAVLFVEDALPGEVVDVQVIKRKRNHAYGVVTHYHSRAAERVEPFCGHFGLCGGCRWQFLPYASQLRYKERFVGEIMRRIGGQQELPLEPILGCETDRFYRNKLDYSFTDSRWLTSEEIEHGGDSIERRGVGFHVRGRFDRVLDIDTCYLQPEPSNEIRRAVRDYTIARGYSYYNPHSHEGWLRSLVVRTATSGAVMLIVALGNDGDPVRREELFDMIESKFPMVVSINYVINDTVNDALAPHEVHHARGQDHIIEQCEHLRLRIHPRSFFQTNARQAERLYALVAQWAGLDGSQVVWDLYSGIGSIALFLASRSRFVWGVEAVAEAVDNAVENARFNAIENVAFSAGDVKDAMLSPPAEACIPDLLVVDPPRAGLHPSVVQAIVRAAVPRIIYVSCNPATQARDLQLMSERYRVIRCRPVDMFPHTHHIESVVEMRLT